MIGRKSFRQRDDESDMKRKQRREKAEKINREKG